MESLNGREPARMGNGSLDKVLQDLNRRFAAPLPEFYKRRIVFWYDEEGKFQDRLDEVTLNNTKLVVLTGTNNFAVKNCWRWMIPRITIWYTAHTSQTRDDLGIPKNQYL